MPAATADETMRRVTVLIVDDHAGFRSLARELLEGQGVRVVGEAEDAQSAVAATAALHPTVVLLDVHLPESDGFAVAQLLAALPGPPVVILISSRPVEELRRRMTVAPVVGFIPKSELSATTIANMVG